MGQYYDRKNNHAEALTCYNKAIKLNNTDGICYKYKTQTLCDTNKILDAIECCS